MSRTISDWNTQVNESTWFLTEEFTILKKIIFQLYNNKIFLYVVKTNTTTWLKNGNFWLTSLEGWI